MMLTKINKLSVLYVEQPPDQLSVAEKMLRRVLFKIIWQYLMRHPMVASVSLDYQESAEKKFILTGSSRWLVYLCGLTNPE